MGFGGDHKFANHPYHAGDIACSSPPLGPSGFQDYGHWTLWDPLREGSCRVVHDDSSAGQTWTNDLLQIPAISYSKAQTRSSEIEPEIVVRMQETLIAAELRMVYSKSVWEVVAHRHSCLRGQSLVAVLETWVAVNLLENYCSTAAVAAAVAMVLDLVSFVALLMIPTMT